MERAVRYSKKREAILAALQGTNCHPSAEWLYRQLKPRHPDLSLGTVYRNLAFFQERGMVQSVGVVQGQGSTLLSPRTVTLFASAAAPFWTFRVSARRGSWSRPSAGNMGSWWNAANSSFSGGAPNV